MDLQLLFVMHLQKPFRSKLVNSGFVILCPKCPILNYTFHQLDARSNQEGVSYAVGSRMASRQRERNRLAKGVSGLGSTIPTDLQLNLIGQDQGETIYELFLFKTKQKDFFVCFLLPLVHSPQLGSPSRKIPTRSSTVCFFSLLFISPFLLSNGVFFLSF